MTVSDFTRRAVWVAAGGRCCICKKRIDTGLADVLVFAGDVAHIAGATDSARSPRGQSEVPLSERDALENLLLLCPNDHRQVDGRLEEQFTEEALLELKHNHEASVKRALDYAFGGTQTLILRVQGDVANQSTDITKSNAVSAVLRQGLVPVSPNHYDGTGPEVRLPSIDDAVAYRAAVTSLLKEAVARIRTAHRNGEFDSLSVFGFADLPSLIQLGYLIGPNIPVHVFERNRTTGSWTWTDESSSLELAVESPADVKGRPMEVVVVVSVSGTADPAGFPNDIQALPRWVVAREAGPGRLSIVTNPKDLDVFTETMKQLLGHLEQRCGSPLTVHLLGPMPMSIGITAGTVLRSKTVTELVLYDFDGQGYTEALRES